MIQQKENHNNNIITAIVLIGAYYSSITVFHKVRV